MGGRGGFRGDRGAQGGEVRASTFKYRGQFLVLGN